MQNKMKPNYIKHVASTWTRKDCMVYIRTIARSMPKNILTYDAKWPLRSLYSQEKLGRSPRTKTKLTLNMLKTGENLVAVVAQRLQPVPWMGRAVRVYDGYGFEPRRQHNFVSTLPQINEWYKNKKSAYETKYCSLMSTVIPVLMGFYC